MANISTIPDDITVRPAAADSALDGWALKLKLDPAKDWSTSTFSVFTEQAVTFTVDDSHKASSPPYVVVKITPAELFIAPTFIKWQLSEDKVLNRTFMAQTIEVLERP